MTVNPETISSKNPAILFNLVNGEWKSSSNYTEFPDPLTGDPIFRVPDTKVSKYTYFFFNIHKKGDKELNEFKFSAEKCPKSGLHNPIKNPERYLLYGAVCSKAASLLIEVPKNLLIILFL